MNSIILYVNDSVEFVPGIDTDVNTNIDYYF